MKRKTGEKPFDRMDIGFIFEISERHSQIWEAKGVKQVCSEAKSNVDFLCVPKSINRVLNDQGLPTLDPLELGLELGLVVPISRLADYPGARVSEQEAQWGVHPQEAPYDIESFLLRHSIPLSYKFVLYNNIPSGEHVFFMESNLATGNSIIVGYDYKSVFGRGGNSGHVSVITKVDSIRDIVVLWEPENNEYINIQFNQLSIGIMKVRDGYWIFGRN